MLLFSDFEVDRCTPAAEAWSLISLLIELEVFTGDELSNIFRCC